MMNPYAPPADPNIETPRPVPWWRRPPVWLAWLEILVGLLLGFGGCVASLATDASLALIGAVVALVVGVGAFALPGVLLLGRHPLRFLGQLLPAALLLRLLWVWARG